MPELPEVETVARGLRAALLGRTLDAVELRRADFFRGDPASLDALVGARLDDVRRAGKYIVLDFAAAVRSQLMLHLGMTGQLTIAPPGAAPRPHTHARFTFGDRELLFRDPRRFGRIALAPAPADPAAFAPLLRIAPGLEPLDATPEQFVALFHARQSPIKSALLNQKLLRGVGNIYADEALFRAGIHPRARALSRPRLRKLRLALRRVIEEAIAAGGSSISDYVDARGEPGTFHLRHRVYARTGEPCFRCRTPIRRLVLGGRSSHFCPVCQKR